MKLESLIGGLNHANPAVRLDVVRVIGMIDEVRALDALRARYQQEPEDSIRQAISWAGKRLLQAQQAGYSTLNEIFRYFNIDREIENTPDALEAEMMRKLEDQLASDVHQMRLSAHKKQLGISAAAGIGMAVLGSTTMGISAAMSGMTTGAGFASSNMGDDRPQLGTTRNPPTAPTNADISTWVKRLREGKLPAQREAAILELSGLNNPAALPHLAAAFIGDESPQVRETAQRYGKILYWNSVYWALERDGTIKAEMERRLHAMGKRTEVVGTAPSAGTPAAPGVAAPNAPVTPPPAEPQVDIGEILRRAQQDREQRKRR